MDRPVGLKRGEELGKDDRGYKYIEKECEEHMVLEAR